MLCSDKLHTKKMIFFVVATGLCLYLNTLGNGFVWDDKYLIEDNLFIRDFSHLKEIFTKHLFYFLRQPAVHYHRPLQILTYLIDHQIWNLNPFGYHLTNVLLHILNSVLIFCFVETLFRMRKIAFFASLLFLIHPLHNAAVAYISGRADPLVTVLILSSTISFMKFIVHGQRPAFYYFLALILFCLSLFTREIAILLPLLLIVVYLFVNTGKKTNGLWNFSFLILPFLIIGYIFAKYIFLGEEDMFLAPNLTSISWLRVLTWFKAVFIYLRIIFLPINLHMERTTSIIDSFGDPLVPFLFLGIVAIGIIMKLVYKHSRISFFGLVWFFLTLIPIFFAMYFKTHILSNNLVIMAEHWLYIPLIGFAIFLASEIEIIQEKCPVIIRSVANTIFILLMIFYVLQTIQMNYIWRNNESLFKNTLKYSPYSYKPYVWLGQIYLRQGKTDKAIALFRDGLAKIPAAPRLYVDLGRAYESKKEKGLAIEAYHKAIELDPLDFLARNNLGVLYAATRQIDKAKEEWKKAFEANPEFEFPHHNLLVANKNDPAIKKYQKLLEKDPLNLNLNLELAGYYFSLGLYPEAIAVLKSCLTLAPRDPVAYNLLGFISLQLRYFKAAERYFKKAIEVSPNFLEPYNNLAALYATLGKPRLAREFWEKALLIDPNSNLVKDNLKKFDQETSPVKNDQTIGK